MRNSELSEQEQIRRNSLEEIRKLGYNPYPPETFECSHNTEEVKSVFERDDSELSNISLAGRIMSRRIMGSASFAEIQDSTGSQRRNHAHQHGSISSRDARHDKSNVGVGWRKDHQL